jgi:SH3-like domain-containing protein
MLRFFIISFSVLLVESSSFSREESFLTLRYDKVNLRQGPSRDYPVKIIYKKRFLPVLVQDKSDNFRKIRDHENNSGWIHVSQLSKKRAALVKDRNIIVFNNPTLYSRPLVILNQGKLCMIIKCRNEWCKIRVDKYKGWVKQTDLWGRM